MLCLNQFLKEILFLTSTRNIDILHIQMNITFSQLQINELVKNEPYRVLTNIFK